MRSAGLPRGRHWLQLILMSSGIAQEDRPRGSGRPWNSQPQDYRIWKSRSASGLTHEQSRTIGMDDGAHGSVQRRRVDNLPHTSADRYRPEMICSACQPGLQHRTFAVGVSRSQKCQQRPNLQSVRTVHEIVQQRTLPMYDRQKSAKPAIADRRGAWRRLAAKYAVTTIFMRARPLLGDDRFE